MNNLEQFLSPEQLKEYEAIMAPFRKQQEELLNFTGFLRGEEVKNHLRKIDSQNRWNAFCKLVENNQLDELALNLGFSFAYTTGDADHRMFTLGIWNKIKMELCCTKGEIDYFAAMPEEVTIYRGTSVEEYETYLEDGESLGYSWTTEREVAEFFAFRHGQKKRMVISTTINKHLIKSVLLDRNESEVLVDVDNIDVEIKMVAKRPTKFFRQYMEKKKK